MRLSLCLAAVAVICSKSAHALSKNDHGRILQNSSTRQCEKCKAACPHRHRHKHTNHVDVKVKEEAELAAAKEKGKEEGHAAAQKLIPEGPYTETPHPSKNKIPRSGEAKAEELSLPEKIEGIDVTESLETAERTLTELPTASEAAATTGEVPVNEMWAPQATELPKQHIDDDEGCSSFLTKTQRRLRNLESRA
ncbi:hypothetical protein TGCAST_253460 [Toxoplasma gondii CAST]|uniref:Uncharacterized protein n=1 Tax=Toxoplasma gondii CAST TaxID=943122 RepID=A0A3R8BQV8_TOXGO|nr:hypothetical protein TGCAST_253460 [Toxoplasma gondii CAST]